MTTFSLKYEYGLEGSSSFVTWKCKVQRLLEEHDLWDFMKIMVVESTNPMQLAKHKKEDGQDKKNHP
jgi:hypothetical protein